MKKFGGFDEPKRNYFSVPKLLIDLLPSLTGSEVKVLLYIIRRTWGFNKIDDLIAYSQFIKGITTRQGEIVDSGTGLSNRQLVRAIKGLEGKGVIEVKRKAGRVSNYSLKYKKPSPKIPVEAIRNKQGKGLKPVSELEFYPTFEEILKRSCSR